MHVSTAAWAMGRAFSGYIVDADILAWFYNIAILFRMASHQYDGLRELVLHHKNLVRALK